MTEKLIDAGKLLFWLDANLATEICITAECLTDHLTLWTGAQPDASLPLREELEASEARINELENSLNDLAICVRALDITEQTHDPSDCAVLGELLATAESLLKGGQDA